MTKKINNTLFIIVFLLLLLLSYGAFRWKPCAISHLPLYTGIALVLCSFVFFAFSIRKYFFQSNRFLWKDFLRDTAILLMAIVQLYDIQFVIWETVFFIIFVCLYAVFTRAKIQWPNIFTWFILLYLLRIAGMFWTSDTRGGSVLIESNLSILLFPILFSFLNLKKETIDWILLWFMRSALFFSAVFLLLILCTSHEFQIPVMDWLKHPKQSYLYIYGIPERAWPHPSYLSVMLSFTAAISIYLFFSKRSRCRISFFEMIVSLFFFATFIYCTGSRIGLVVFPAVILLASYMYINIRILLKTFLLVVILLAGIVIVESDKYVHTDDAPREQLHAMSIEAIKERPLSGYGTGAQMGIVQSTERAQALGYENIYCPTCVHPHNQFLTEALQFGVILGLVLPLLLLTLLILGWRNESYLLLSFLVIEIFFMIVESPLDTQKGVSFFAFFATFLVSIIHTQYTARKKTTFTTSLIVTTYNNLPALSCVLDDIKKQSILPLEVIIADDGSTQETATFISQKAAAFPVPLLHCWHEDTGFRAAAIRNKAMAAASGEYIVLIDGDMRLHHYFLRDHIREAYKDVYLQGSRVILSQQKSQEIYDKDKVRIGFFSNGIGNRMNTLSQPWLSHVFSLTHHHFWISGTKTCNLSLWRDDAIKVNGFDEDFVGWGREDSDFVARLFFAGIHRKNLRFGGVAYHLFHKNNAHTDLLKLNDERLKQTIKQRKTSCTNGLNKYLELDKKSLLRHINATQNEE